MAASVATTPTFDSTTRLLEGNIDHVTTTLDLGAYATGGVAVTAALFGLSVIYDMTSPLSADSSIQYSYDPADGKVKALVLADGSEVADTTNLSATGKPCRITVMGRR